MAKGAGKRPKSKSPTRPPKRASTAAVKGRPKATRPKPSARPKAGKEPAKARKASKPTPSNTSRSAKARVKSASPSKPTSPAAKETVAAPVKPAKLGPNDADLSVSGHIYQKGKLVPGVLHVNTQTGKIVRIVKAQTLPDHLDFGGKAILPGFIDVHVHFREPGHTHKEDWTTGSTAAAFGGVTGVVDMPNTLPATISLRTVKEKLAIAQAKSVVDFGVWAGGTWYTGEMEEMLRWAVGVKTYLGSSTGDLLLEDLAKFSDILTIAGKAGRPVMLHCEAQKVLNQLRRNEGTLEDHDQARPALAEVEAIYDAMRAQAQVKKPPVIHIAHIASPDAVQAATSAKFSMGACPHHLLLDTACGLSHAYGKMNPPLRAPAIRKMMWDTFATGAIGILESDHAPHTKVEKEDAFHNAPSGVPGVETLGPLMLAQAGAKLPLATVVDALTTGPARLIGAKDRGTLEPGMRADFAVYDLKKPTKVEAASLHSRCGWTPFVGHKACFPTHTFLAGKPVVADGELVAAPGSARPILPLPGPLA